jgi:hypothetical protein
VLATSIAAALGTVGGVRTVIAASVPSVLNVILNGLIGAAQIFFKISQIISPLKKISCIVYLLQTSILDREPPFTASVRVTAGFNKRAAAGVNGPGAGLRALPQ